MPRDLFETVVDPGRTVGGRKWYTVPLSILAHTAIIAAAIVMPLMATGALPMTPSLVTYVQPVPPPTAPPEPPPRATSERRAERPVPVNPHAAPIVPPSEIRPETTLEIGSPEGDPDGIVGGITGGLTTPIVEGLPAELPPVPPPAAPRRVGGQIKAPVKTRDVRPVYPALAQSARVEGIVIIEATIGPDGRVTDAKVLRSIPLLDQAAIDAVRQWEFTPTLLNGVPVPLIMTVTVRFQLH